MKDISALDHRVGNTTHRFVRPGRVARRVASITDSGPHHVDLDDAGPFAKEISHSRSTVYERTRTRRCPSRSGTQMTTNEDAVRSCYRIVARAESHRARRSRTRAIGASAKDAVPRASQAVGQGRGSGEVMDPAVPRRHRARREIRYRTSRTARRPRCTGPGCSPHGLTKIKGDSGPLWGDTHSADPQEIDHSMKPFVIDRVAVGLPTDFITIRYGRSVRGLGSEYDTVMRTLKRSASSSEKRRSRSGERLTST